MGEDRAVDRGDRPAYISPSTGGVVSLLALAVWWFPTSNGVDRLCRFTCCGRESEIDRLGGFSVSRRVGRFFDNLVRRKRSVDGEVFAGAASAVP
jgi:hypothetical protein